MSAVDSKADQASHMRSLMRERLSAPLTRNEKKKVAAILGFVEGLAEEGDSSCLWSNLKEAIDYTPSWRVVEELTNLGFRCGRYDLGWDSEVNRRPAKIQTIASLMAEHRKHRRDVRLIGIKRNGDAVRVHIFDGKVDVNAEMTWFPDWNAWSVRLAQGPYQQLCIFERAEAVAGE